jgi:hypothetical protein
MKTSLLTILYFALIIGSIVGEVKCIMKMINCNFEPIGKAEVFYTVGTFTGAGCLIGYFDIKDN